MRARSLISRSLTVSCLALPALGCGGASAVDPASELTAISHLSLSPDSASVPFGDRIEFRAIVIDAEGDTIMDLGPHNQSVAWVVFDTSPDIIAAISPDESVHGSVASVRGTQQGWAGVVAAMHITTGMLSDTSTLEVTALQP